MYVNLHYSRRRCRFDMVIYRWRLHHHGDINHNSADILPSVRRETDLGRSYRGEGARRRDLGEKSKAEPI